MKAIEGALVILTLDYYEGVGFITVACADYDVYKTLPSVVAHDGKIYGLTSHNSDTGRACYRTDARIAYRADQSYLQNHLYRS